MTYTIVATKSGTTVSTMRITPVSSVEKARGLISDGWVVVISDQSGRVFRPSEFDHLADEHVLA